MAESSGDDPPLGYLTTALRQQFEHSLAREDNPQLERTRGAVAVRPFSQKDLQFHRCTRRELELTLRGVSYEKPEVIARRVGENSPPANMRNFRFGMHRFPSACFYNG